MLTLAQRRDTYRVIQRFATKPSLRQLQALHYLLKAQQCDLYKQTLSLSSNLGLTIDQSNTTMLKSIILELPIPQKLKPKHDIGINTTDLTSLYEATISKEHRTNQSKGD